jgi:hypothetical protein
MISLPPTHIQVPHHDGEVQVARQARHKLGVFVGLSPPETVVHVGHHRLQGKLATEAVKNLAEGYGIRSARDGQDYSGAGRDHPVTGDGLTDFSKEHRHIPTRVVCYLL